MALNYQPIYPQAIRNEGAVLTTATLTSLVTANENGSLVDVLVASSTENTKTLTLDVFISDGTTDYIVCTVPVINEESGQDVLNAMGFFNNVIMLKANNILKVKLSDAPTTNKTVTVFASGRNY